MTFGSTANTIIWCFADWGISAKFYTIVMDNAANVMAVVRLVKSIQLALLAHKINMVFHSSKLIKPIKLKVKAIVEYFLQSSLKTMRQRFHRFRRYLFQWVPRFTIPSTPKQKILDVTKQLRNITAIVTNTNISDAKLENCLEIWLALRWEHNINSITEAVMPTVFKALFSSVKTVAGFDEQNCAYTAPSVALKFGHALLKCATILKS